MPGKRNAYPSVRYFEEYQVLVGVDDTKRYTPLLELLREGVAAIPVVLRRPLQPQSAGMLRRFPTKHDLPSAHTSGYG